MALWTPALLGSALVAWYKADSLALADGSPVSQWPNSSVNNHPLYQTVGNSFCPTFVANALNGLPILRFGAGPQWLTTNGSATLFPTIPQPFNIFLLARPTDISGASHWWVVGDGAGVSLGLFMGTNVTNVSFSWAGGGTSINRPDSTSWKLRHAFLSGASSETRFDGDAPVNSGDIGSDHFVGTLSLANFQNGSAVSAIEILEILIVTGAIASINRQFIEGYLNWRAGLQASLPSDHPYKSAPPEGPSLIQATDGIACGFAESALGWPVLPVDLITADVETEQ